MLFRCSGIFGGLSKLRVGSVGSGGARVRHPFRWFRGDIILCLPGIFLRCRICKDSGERIGSLGTRLVDIFGGYFVGSFLSPGFIVAYFGELSKLLG